MLTFSFKTMFLFKIIGPHLTAQLFTEVADIDYKKLPGIAAIDQSQTKTMQLYQCIMRPWQTFIVSANESCLQIRLRSHQLLMSSLCSFS